MLIAETEQLAQQIDNITDASHRLRDNLEMKEKEKTKKADKANKKGGRPLKCLLNQQQNNATKKNILKLVRK